MGAQSSIPAQGDHSQSLTACRFKAPLATIINNTSLERTYLLISAVLATFLNYVIPFQSAHFQFSILGLWIGKSVQYH